MPVAPVRSLSISTLREGISKTRRTSSAPTATPGPKGDPSTKAHEATEYARLARPLSEVNALIS